MLLKIVLILIPLCLFSLMVAAMVGVIRNGRMHHWLFAIAGAAFLGGLICNLMTRLSSPPNSTLFLLSLYFTLAGTITGTLGAWWYIGFGPKAPTTVGPEAQSMEPEV